MYGVKKKIMNLYLKEYRLPIDDFFREGRKEMRHPHSNRCIHFLLNTHITCCGCQWIAHGMLALLEFITIKLYTHKIFLAIERSKILIVAFVTLADKSNHINNIK